MRQESRAAWVMGGVIGFVGSLPILTFCKWKRSVDPDKESTKHTTVQLRVLAGEFLQERKRKGITKNRQKRKRMSRTQPASSTYCQSIQLYTFKK